MIVPTPLTHAAYSLPIPSNVLSISGKVEHVAESQSSDSKYQFTERSYGSFERKLAVPPSLKESEISAKLEDGLLKVSRNVLRLGMLLAVADEGTQIGRAHV